MTDRYNAATYFELILKPTFDDYQSEPYNFRRVILAAIMMSNTPEYITHDQFKDVAKATQEGRALKKAWALESKDFHRVARLSDAAKHGRLSQTEEAAFPSYFRSPARAGMWVMGHSVLGDGIGQFKINIDNEKDINVHPMMSDTYAFISQKIQDHGGDVRSFLHTEWQRGKRLLKSPD